MKWLLQGGVCNACEGQVLFAILPSGDEVALDLQGVAVVEYAPGLYITDSAGPTITARVATMDDPLPGLRHSLHRAKCHLRSVR